MSRWDEHWDTPGRKVWTVSYFLTWVILIIGTIIWNMAIVDIVPELTNLPSNIKKGFMDALAFVDLQQDAATVKDTAADALAKCNVLPTQCPGEGGQLPQSYNPMDKSSNTDNEKSTILGRFDHSLAKVRKVCNDKYFGVPAFNQTAQSLNEITKQVEEIDAGGMPCLASNVLYCGIYDSAVLIVKGMGDVNKQIDDFTDGEIIQQYNEYAPRLNAAHGFPAILIISACLFGCLWWKDGTCCCCKDGSMLGCCLIFGHAFVWLVFFILVTVFVAIGIAIKIAKDRVAVDMLNGKPTIEETLEHLRTEYPEFWNLVLDKLTKGLDTMYKSSCVMWVFCVVIVIYGCCMCCCRPYAKDSTTDTKVENIEKGELKNTAT